MISIISKYKHIRNLILLATVLELKYLGCTTLIRGSNLFLYSLDVVIKETLSNFLHKKHHQFQLMA